MDTKLNPNGPRIEDFPKKEPPRIEDFVKKEPPRVEDFPEKEPPRKERRRTRVKRKWVGFVILAVSLLLITLGAMCQINTNNAMRYNGMTLYGAHDTQISFVYYGIGQSIVYGLENLINNLITVSEPISQEAAVTYTQEELSESAALYAAVTQGVAPYPSFSPPSVTVSDSASITVTVPQTEVVISTPQSSYQIQGSEVVEYYMQLIEQSQLRDQLLSEREYLFYMLLSDGSVFSNFQPGETLESLRSSARLILNLNQPASNTYFFNMDMNAVADKLNGWGVYGEVFIPASSDGWSYVQEYLYEDEYTRIMLREQQNTGRVCLIVGWVLLLLGFVFQRKNMMAVIGSLYGLYLKQPLVMKLAGMFASVCLLFFNLAEMGLHYYYRIDVTRPDFVMELIVWTLIVLYALLSLLYLVAALPRLKQTLANEPDVRFLRKYVNNMRAILLTKDYLLIGLSVICTVGALGLILLALLGFVFIIDQEPGVALLFGLCVAGGGFIVAVAFSLLFSYTRMILYTENIMRGNYHPFAVGKGWFTKPLRNLENISEGMRTAVSEAVKSERMKTELITNVSHDLKTPLTAIINYVALLKDTPFAQERTASEYVDVIERKTQRLKVLIDDLFEASRLNSGAVELQPEDVNAVELLKQSLGELSEKIEDSGIHFIEQYEAERIILYVDGKKIWRVFENLIGNILKYAPAGSRAYIRVEVVEKEAVFTFKNVSNYALDQMAPEELFERFKRGDPSRTTEGSGLGLSIARSIVEHSGGQLQITTDGDLFKAVIRFPLAHA